MKDKIKEILNVALEKSGEKPQNVLITGKTGTGKTSSVNEWFKEHPEVREYNFFANQRPRLSNNVYFVADECEKFNQDGTVLFIDHFDLTHDDARRHLLNLVENREVVCNPDGETMHLDNLKMVIAVAFEMGSEHFGYTPLTEADITGFDYVVSVN